MRELVDFLLQKCAIKTTVKAYQQCVIIESEVFEPKRAVVPTANGFALASCEDYYKNMIAVVMNALENGYVRFCIDTNYDEDNEELVELLNSLGAKLCSTPDGACGFMGDVTQEDWYKKTPITLYDELECDCYDLICKYAKFLGIYLNPEEVDFDMAKSVQETVMEKVEEAFGIPFPLYGEVSHDAS